MFHLRLRQAQTALKDGRLDEALELAGEKEVRDHRDGQRLVTKLVAALVKRGRSHLEAGRIDEAGRDCRNSRQLGGNLESVALLAADVANAERKRRQSRQHKDEMIRDARAELNHGAMSLGGRILERAAEGDSTIGAMTEQAGVRRERIEAALRRARELAGSSPTAQAKAAVLELQQICPQHVELPSLIEKVVRPVLADARAELETGRLDRASRAIDSVSDLTTNDGEAAEIRLLFEQARQAADLLESGSYSEAAIELRKLMTVLGEPAWLANVFEMTEQASALQSELRSTPLSLMSSAGTLSLPATQPRPARRPAVIPGPIAGSTRFLLQLDGGGSFLLLPSPHVRIGRSNQNSVDVPLQGYSSGSPAAIERSGDEYLIRSDDPFEVDRRPFTRKLLDRDETIAFGRRCRVRFRRPNAAASSAVLELSGARLARPDIRGIVLLDESLVIGPGRSAHVPVTESSAHGVLFLRNGEFFFRRGLRHRRGSGSSSTPRPVPVGTPVDLSGARVTVSPVTHL